MFLAHSFRLRDPWQCEPAEQGALRWSRVFHRPSGLEPDDQLVLVISGLPESALVAVNGQQLSGNPQFNLSALLRDANTIELVVPASDAGRQPPASPPAFPYDARLAIVARS